MNGKILIGGNEIKYRVRRNNSRYLSLRLKENLELEIALPRHLDLDAEKILESKKRWIERKYEELSNRKQVLQGNKVLHKGVQYDMRVINTDKVRLKVELDEGTRIITIYTDQGDPLSVLQKWMKKMTTNHVRRQMDKFARVMGVECGKIFIRSMKKWGSCSTKKKLSFNSQLIALPEQLSEYVIIHELAHLAEFNHSRNFWKIVASICSDFAERRRSLKGYAPLYPVPDICKPSSGDLR